MNSKTELDYNFEPPNDAEIFHYHLENIWLTTLFAIPVFGWAILFLVLLGELFYHWYRLTRLFFKILLHKINSLWKQMKKNFKGIQ